MTSRVKIENVKNIKKLEFTLPYQEGVFLLVGPNGAGKTTLLTCLDRIGNPWAFAQNFTSSSLNNEVDQYKASLITYKIDELGINLRYRKKNKRWSVTPKKGNSELSAFGYTSTVFIQADATRIAIPVDDIRQGDFVQVPQCVKEDMNELFESGRFNQLKRLKNTYGRGKKARFYYVLKEGDKYYSEKRFSTGELALLRLVERITDISPKSLILLDEAEMALHPRIQKNLLDYLKRKAKEKNLTVIIATHSITMIKAVDRDHIIMLEESSKGRFEVICPCYSAKAIGCVDFIENTSYDTVIFVEDDMAKLIMERMVSRCMSDEQISTIKWFVVPVGGYENTAELALQTRDSILGGSKVFAVWDTDVFLEVIPKSQKIKELYERNKDVIFDLGCTPEVWLVDALESNNSIIKKRIRDKFQIEVRNILKSDSYTKCNSDNPRKLAKSKLDVALKMMKSTSGMGEDETLMSFIDVIMDSTLDKGKIKRIVMPMLSKVR